jgi:D-alanyl-D-alanine carboxypeptidase (penicillin-binding protein 5/6)
MPVVVRRLVLAILLLAALAAALGLAHGEAKHRKPWLTAEAYVAIDADSGTVLVAKNERERRPIASLTKIMTGLLAIEHGDLGRKIRVPKEATLVEPNRDGLKSHRWYSRELLLYSMLLGSNNDAADTIGYDLGGGSLVRFYAEMDARARDLGLADTVYSSASGLNDVGNYSTALDQAVLSRFALENPSFARVVRTKRKIFPWPRPTFAKEYINHNRMLFTYPGTYGVKTGYTSRAGGCLAVAVRRDGHSVIAVLLDSQNIWLDMPKLVRRAFRGLGVVHS